MTVRLTIAILFTFWISSCQGCDDESAAPSSAAEVDAVTADRCGRGASPSSGGGRRGALVKQGACHWFEHADREKYLHVCVRRVFEDEAEITSEWRLYERIRKGVAKSTNNLAPDRLSHHVTSCTTISRSNISVLVYGLEEGQLTLERL